MKDQIFSKIGRRKRGGRLLRIAADIADMTGCGEVSRLYQRCVQSLRDRTISRLSVDLAGVQKADTKLIACLVAICRMARSLRVQVEITISRPIEEMLRFCRLEAIASCQSVQLIAAPSLSPVAAAVESDSYDHPDKAPRTQ